MAKELINVANSILATRAEKQVEELLKVVLRGTSYFGKTFAVGGYPRDEYLGLDAKDLDIVIEMRGGAKKLTHYLREQFPDAVSRPIQKGHYPIWAVVFKDNIKFNLIVLER